MCAAYSTIVGGYDNQMCVGEHCWPSYSVIAGGGSNIINDETIYNAISGGFCNFINLSSYDTISGGCGNCICYASNGSTISGGYGNFIGGVQDGWQCLSFIGSGQNNCITGAISGGCASFGVISGGCNNTISNACFSAILGGSGNTIGAGFDHVGIFGQNITNVCSNTFHVNCLNACDTPGYSASLPTGTIFKHSGSAPPSGTPLYIM